jgi:hypothetical protein
MVVVTLFVPVSIREKESLMERVRARDYSVLQFKGAEF